MPNSMRGILRSTVRCVESSGSPPAQGPAPSCMFREPNALGADTTTCSAAWRRPAGAETPKEGNAMADPVHHKARMSPVSRRSFLQTLGVAGAAAGVAPAFLRRADAQEFMLKAADPAAKPGGTLRFGILNAPAHFEVHTPGTTPQIAVDL